jgi:uncharacterized protein YcfJ
MKRELMCLAGIVSVVVGLTAFNAMAESYNVSGKVTSVTPIYQTRTNSVPQQSCWTEEVPVYGKSGNTDPTGDMLTGAIIGGLIGNNLKGEDGGGAAGAMLGGILGHQNAKKKGSDVITGYRQVQQCKTTYINQTEEYLAGYEINYEALGLKGMVKRNRAASVGDTIDVHIRMNAY